LLLFRTPNDLSECFGVPAEGVTAFSRNVDEGARLASDADSFDM
jgi:hypothetical protein